MFKSNIGSINYEYLSSCWVLKCKNYMSRFVSKNIFIKIYIYHFLINIFIEIRYQSYVLKTVSLSKTTFFMSMEGVYANLAICDN